MFFKNAPTRTQELIRQIEELENERDRLEDRNSKLAREVIELKHTKQMELDETQHIVKMREEALNLDFEKRCMENERNRDGEIARVKDAYRDKMEKRLETEVTNIKEMYEKILERLPKVSIRQMDTRHEDIG